MPKFTFNKNTKSYTAEADTESYKITSTTTGTDTLLVQPGASVSSLNLGKGVDEIHLGGASSDWTVVSKKSTSLTFINKNDEDYNVTVTADKTAKDKVFFEDGFVTLGMSKGKINFGKIVVKTKKEYDLEDESNSEAIDIDDSEVTKVIGDGPNPTPGDEYTVVKVDGIGKPNAPELITDGSDGQVEDIQDISTLAIDIQDDVNKANNVKVEGFGDDDKITLFNVKNKANLEISSNLGDVDISYTVGVQTSKITLLGIYTPDAWDENGPYNLQTFNALPDFGDIYFS